MIYSIDTYYKPCTLELDIVTTSNRKLIIAGFDVSKENTKYFFREMLVNGERKFTFNMPISPEQLKVVIFDFEENKPYERTSEFFTVKHLKLKELPLNNVNYNENTRIWVDLVKSFCNECGYIQRGRYSDDGNVFDIRFMDKIVDEKGEEIGTPARIHKIENYIEVSKRYFDKLTVPSRIMILNHEFSHNFVNREKDNEVEADINGLKIYLDMQLPVIEAIYAFTQIFHDSPDQINRLEVIIAYLSHYEKDKSNMGYYKQVYTDYKNKTK